MEGLCLRPWLELRAIDLNLSFFSYSCRCNCEIVKSVNHLNPLGTCFSWHFITTTGSILINFDTTAFHGLLVSYFLLSMSSYFPQNQGPKQINPRIPFQGSVSLDHTLQQFYISLGVISLYQSRDWFKQGQFNIKNYEAMVTVYL